MLQVSPVRAFSDNYIWLIRAPADPAAAVVVDPGDDRPVDAALQQHGLQLRAILVTHHHADHVGGVAGTGRQARGTRSSDRPAKKCLAMCRRWTKATRQHLNTSGSNSRVMAIPGTYARAHRLRRSRRPLLRRHAFQRRLRPPVRRHARADARFPRSPGRAARCDAGVLRPRIHGLEPPVRRGRRTRQPRRPRGAGRGALAARTRRSHAAVHAWARASHQPFPALPRTIACALRPNATLAVRCRPPSTCLPTVRAWKDGFR